METAIRSYSVKSFLTSVKNKLSEAPPVWVHGVITQFTEKGNMVYMSIADFREGDVKPEATIALSCYAGRFAEIRAKAETFLDVRLLETLHAFERRFCAAV